VRNNFRFFRDGFQYKYQVKNRDGFTVAALPPITKGNSPGERKKEKGEQLLSDGGDGEEKN
jgi:hypothetical protein